MAYGENMAVLNPCPPEMIAEILQNNNYLTGRLLDIGCGRGTTLRCLAGEFPGMELHGLDLAVPEVMPDEKIAFCSGNAEALPYPDAHFNAVLCECSYSLFTNPKLCAPEIVRVLKPDGILILSDLYSADTAAVSAAENCTVRNIYSASAIETQLKSVGLFQTGFKDRTSDLTEMVTRMIWDGSFCNCLDTETATLLKTIRPRYGVWTFLRRKENSTMNRDDRALEYFDSGFNCAQSVCTACSDLIGLDEKQALAVSGGFGGGLASGEACGALCGAVIAISMLFPNTTPNNPAGKEKLRNIVKDACERFSGEFGCLACRDLVEKFGGKEHCEEFVQYCTQLVEDILEDYGE